MRTTLAAVAAVAVLLTAGCGEPEQHFVEASFIDPPTPATFGRTADRPTVAIGASRTDRDVHVVFELPEGITIDKHIGILSGSMPRRPGSRGSMALISDGYSIDEAAEELRTQGAALGFDPARIEPWRQQAQAHLDNAKPGDLRDRQFWSGPTIDYLRTSVNVNTHPDSQDVSITWTLLWRWPEDT